MKHELFALEATQVFVFLSVVSCSQSHNTEGLGLSASKHCRSVNRWENIEFNGNIANLIELAAIVTDSFFENAVANDFHLAKIQMFFDFFE